MVLFVRHYHVLMNWRKKTDWKPNKLCGRARQTTCVKDLHNTTKT